MASLLSKSKYLAGCQCPRRVWLTCRAPELGSPPDPAPQAMFEQGHQVGRCAHALFPGGVLVGQPAWEHAAAVARTRALLADPAVPAIFEAAFEHDGVRIRVDALERLPSGGFGLREVKASSRVKPEHVEDCAVQRYVLEGAGLRVASVELVHIDTSYLRGEDGIDWRAFFQRADVGAAVDAALPGVRERVARFLEIVVGPRAPEIAPDGHCFAPHDCEFWEHCTRGMPADWIFHLPGGAKAFETLRAAGIARISEIPDGFALSERQARVRDALRSGRVQLAPGLREALRAAGPPAHYLDFETTNPAIPLYAGTRPFQAVPFQWSLHSDAGDGALRHREQLANEGADPRRAVAEALLDALAGDDAPVLVYSAYESRLLGELAERFPDLASRLRAIRGRLFDLYPVVRRHLYHPGFDFSLSLKAVAPALVPGLGWDDLGELADGASASAAFADLAAGRVPEAERSALRTALLRYCARDTLALAQVHRALLALSGAA